MLVSNVGLSSTYMGMAQQGAERTLGLIRNPGNLDQKTLFNFGKKNELDTMQNGLFAKMEDAKQKKEEQIRNENIKRSFSTFCATA